MTEELWDASYAALDTAIVESVLGLFKDTGIELVATNASAADVAHTLAATIGFTGVEFRGCLVVTTHSSIVAESRPPRSPESAPSDAELDDWLGELANQLLGRIKNRLLQRGIEFEMSLPVVIRGRWLSCALPNATISRRMLFHHDLGSVYVCLDASVDAGTALKAGAPVKGALTEGDVCLF